MPVIVFYQYYSEEEKTLNGMHNTGNSYFKMTKIGKCLLRTNCQLLLQNGKKGKGVYSGQTVCDGSCEWKG